MNTFLLSFDANTTITGSTPPRLEILVGGALVASVDMSAGATSYDVFVEYTGTAPSTLSVRFAGASGSAGDSINFTSMDVNGTALNLGTDLTATLLAQSQSSTITAAADLYGHTTPTLGTPTITGTGGDDDDLRGEDGVADIIDGLAGADRAYGFGGDDEINGGAGADSLFGQGGADTILGGAGDDFIMGNADNDVLFGEGDNDTIIGGAGDDIINGGSGNDGLIGDDGDDVIFGEDGDDWLIGGAGQDILIGDDGDDFIVGGADNDALAGGIGNDQLIGGAGDDLMSGGDDDDELIGEAGADRIDGDGGRDDIYGGDGDDVINGGDNDDYISGGDDNDTIDGGSGVDTIIGGAGADTIDGGDGNDTIHAHGLDAATISDILFNNPNVVYNEDNGSFYQFIAGFANDGAGAETAANATALNGVNGHLAVITTAAELTYLDGIAAGDSYWLGGSDAVTEDVWLWNYGPETGVQWAQGATAVNNFASLFAAGQPNDGTSGNLAYLWSASDGVADASNTGFTHHVGYIVEWEAGLFSDDNAADILDGGAGNDWLYGYGGNDTISGGDDNDNIFAGAGDDTLSGNAGDDTLMGNAGTDIADYSDSVGAVTVNLLTGTATGEGTDTLISIENVTGSSGDDVLQGDGSQNVLDGGDGADEIRANEQTEIAVNSTTLLSYGGGQDAGGAINYMDDDVGVELDGNLWKKFLVNYTVTANTVIEFDFRSTNEAEISGIGFDNDNNIDSNATFKVYGTQNWGRNNFDNYDGSGNWTHYEIDIGSFYTGTFSHLFLVNDDDGGGDDGEGYWRNIIIHEGNTDDNTIAGGSGADDLYGGAEIDTFDFDDLASVDNIHFFNENEDILDISDILTGTFSGTITDYLQFTNNGDHVTVSVDANGTAGGASFTDIAEIRGAADLDEATLYTNGQILV